VTQRPPALTTELRFDRYGELLAKPEWQRGIFVSLELTIAVTAICLALGAMAAYPLARLELPGKRTLLTILIFTQMVPAIVMAIPVLLIFRAVGLKDTVLGLVIVNVAYWLPLVIWLLRNVLEDVPRSLEFAARIDGCSRLGALFRVLIPAAAPGFAAVAIILLIGTWNEFLFAVMLGDRNAVTVTRLIGFLDSTVGPDGPPPFTLLAAAGIVAIAPCLVLVMAFHRRVVAGLTQGFVKG
jgi:multiple sugar transport system permease protein